MSADSRCSDLGRECQARETLFSCPFCGEVDFDRIGLELHFDNGHCDVYKPYVRSADRDAAVSAERERIRLELLETADEHYKPTGNARDWLAANHCKKAAAKALRDFAKRLEPKL